MTAENDPGAGPVDEPVRPVAGARWYALSRDGAATLCVDEEDAKEVAAESWVLYPNNGPYRVAQMVDAGTVDEAVAAERERIRARLLAMDDAVSGRHNYYAHAAVVLFGANAELCGRP